jgi:ribosomal protein L37AE/L43A
MDPFTMTTSIVTLVKNCVDLIKSIQSKDGKINSISVNDFSDLQNNLININQYMEELKNQLIQRDKEIERLERALKDKNCFVFKKYYYFEVDTNGNEIDGPFCQKCFEANKMKIHLLPRAEKGSWWCSSCNKALYDNNYEPKQTGQRWWTDDFKN